MSKIEELLTPTDIARIAGIPVPTLYQQRHKRVGLGGLSIRVGRHLRWRPEDVERWLDEQSERARKEAAQ